MIAIISFEESSWTFIAKLAAIIQSQRQTGHANKCSGRIATRLALHQESIFKSFDQLFRKHGAT